MKKFNFRLQKLLEIRRNAEQKSIIEFKYAENEKKAVEFKLNSLKKDFKRYHNTETEETTIEKKMLQNYLNSLTQSIDNTEVLLEKKAKISQEKREIVKNKQIERKVVETLKQNKLVMYTKEQNHLEQKMNDEFALYGYYRNYIKRR